MSEAAKEAITNSTRKNFESAVLLKQLIRSLPIIFLASLLGLWLHKAGWLSPFENASFDLVAGENRLSLPQISKFLQVVDIDTNDYATLFNRTSPLDAQRLSELLSAIATGNPRIIVVNVQTDSVSQSDIKVPTFNGSIIWARTWKPLDSEKLAQLLGDGSKRSPDLGHCRRFAFLPQPVLGGAEYKNLLSGIVFLPTDADGSVRRYCRRLQLYQKQDGTESLEPGDSLPWCVVKEFNSTYSQRDTNEPNEVLIRFSNNPDMLPRLSASEVLKIQGKPGWLELARNKIVILGGTFAEARDSYATPAGRTSGLSLITQVIASELNNAGITKVSDGWLLFLQIALSTLFVLFSLSFSGTWVPIAGLMAIPFAAFAASSVILQNAALWVNFVPALFVVQTYSIYQHVQEIRKRNFELKTTNQQLQQTRHELARGIDDFSHRERKRLSEHLHDETMMDLFQIETSITPLKDQNSEVYETTIERLQQTRRHIREMMEDLFPSVLKSHGVSEGINSLCRSLSSPQCQIEYSDTTGDATRSLSEQDQFRLYRIAQNALSNALQHSGADRVSVALAITNGDLVMSVRDNGKGLGATTGSNVGSQGMANMKAGAALLNGIIEWTTPASDFEKGTQVTLRIMAPGAGNH